MKHYAVNTRTVRREYNAGFDSGTSQKADLQSESTPANMRFLINENVNRKMISGCKDEYPLVRAYWQGYYDAIQGFMRNEGYTTTTKTNFPK